MHYARYFKYIWKIKTCPPLWCSPSGSLINEIRIHAVQDDLEQRQGKREADEGDHYLVDGGKLVRRVTLEIWSRYITDQASVARLTSEMVWGFETLFIRQCAHTSYTQMVLCQCFFLISSIVVLSTCFITIRYSFINCYYSFIKFDPLVKCYRKQ